MRGYRTVINGLYVKIKKIGIICIVKNDSTHIIKFVVVSNARKLQNKQVVTLANAIRALENISIWRVALNANTPSGASFVRAVAPLMAAIRLADGVQR